MNNIYQKLFLPIHMIDLWVQVLKYLRINILRRGTFIATQVLDISRTLMKWVQLTSLPVADLDTVSLRHLPGSYLYPSPLDSCRFHLTRRSPLDSPRLFRIRLHSWTTILNSILSLSKYTLRHPPTHPFLQITVHIFSNHPPFLSIPNSPFLLPSRSTTVFPLQLQLLPSNFFPLHPPPPLYPKHILLHRICTRLLHLMKNPQGNYHNLKTPHGHYLSNLKLFTLSRLFKHPTHCLSLQV